MTGKEISEMQTKYVLQGWSKQGGLNPTPVDHCEGIYIYDKDRKRYADMSSEQVNVNVGGDVFTFEGDGYNVGQEVKVFFDTNGEPTNPWGWWVIDCKPLH